MAEEVFLIGYILILQVTNSHGMDTFLNTSYVAFTYCSKALMWNSSYHVMFRSIADATRSQKVGHFPHDYVGEVDPLGCFQRALIEPVLPAGVSILEAALHFTSITKVSDILISY